MASFVSATELSLEREKRKEKRRIARKEILEEAKESFFKEKKKREQREERGDDKWLAPGIDKRLDYSYEKKKKKKKHKKEKKRHRKHQNDEDSKSEKSDEEEDDQWIEKPHEDKEGEAMETATSTEVLPEVLERQEWMMIPLGPSAATKRHREEEIAAIERKKKEEQLSSAAIGQHPRELNPYWKDGGRGLPEQDKEKARTTASVGDGGRSWLLRSYKRALERSKEESISMEEIATQRWGSLNNLYSLLEDAGIDPQNPDGDSGNRRKKYLFVGHQSSDSGHHSSQKKMDKPSYEPFKPSRGGFMRPGESTSRDLHTSSSSSSSNSWLKKLSSQSSDAVSYSTNQILSPPRSDTPPSPPQSPTTPPSESTMPPEPSEPLVTDAQLNSLGAKLVKAEMMGDTARIEKIKKKLGELRNLQKSQKEMGLKLKTEVKHHKTQQQEQTLLITKTDRFGHVRPMEEPRYTAERSKRDTHSDKGKRNKYFSDDDKYSLKDLIRQERTLTAEETHSAIARMASKFVPSTNTDETVDDVLDSSKLLKNDPQKEQKKAQMRAVAETRAMNEALRSCKMCVGNELFEKHLMVAIGLEVYLAVPSYQPLTEGHCLLVPREHTHCSLQMDENVWSEIAIFRKGLTKMFSDRDMDVVFMEVYSNVHGKRHMCIECVPLPKETGELAPMYFKKAIMESDAEWSDNKKLIDTSKKGVRSSLPKGLPYFFVEFGTDGGYGHVIEDQSKFPWYFGKEVCGGMLDCEPRLWLKPQRDTFERQKLRVLQLSGWWKDYDWTQKINEYQ